LIRIEAVKAGSERGRSFSMVVLRPSCSKVRGVALAILSHQDSSRDVRRAVKLVLNEGLSLKVPLQRVISLGNEMISMA
jgi:hypothetical protein